MTKILLAILAIVFAIFTTTSFAQRRIDLHPTTTGCYRQPVTPISQPLTLTSDMPQDCILGYTYFDSLCRALGSFHEADSLIARITGWDNMRIFMRYTYRMQEYDADLYKEYLYGAGDIVTDYNVVPAAIEHRFWKQMNQQLGPKNKFNYLSIAPVIVHIRVVDVGSSYDSLCSNPVWPQPRKCITAIVVDTIKGMHLRKGTPIPGYTLEANYTIPKTEYSWINIAYSPLSPKLNERGDIIDMGPIDNTTGDTHIDCPDCYGNNVFEPNKEYIVFLDNLLLDYNGTYSFYEYVPYNSYNPEGGVFPISSDGNIRMQSNYFGYGTSVPTSSFKKLLRVDIESIISH
jgi:hypothetical protein